jgi:hypothetical protein
MVRTCAIPGNVLGGSLNCFTGRALEWPITSLSTSAHHTRKAGPAPRLAAALRSEKSRDTRPRSTLFQNKLGVKISQSEVRGDEPYFSPQTVPIRPELKTMVLRSLNLVWSMPSSDLFRHGREMEASEVDDARYLIIYHVQCTCSRRLNP